MISHYSEQKNDSVPFIASFTRCCTDILRESQNLLFSPTSPDKELIYRPDILAPDQVLQSSDERQTITACQFPAKLYLCILTSITLYYETPSLFCLRNTRLSVPH